VLSPKSSPLAALAPARGEAVPALSRQEAERIRMHQVDAETLQLWQARAGRIKAPEPPAEGALVPNHTGWLVARGDVHARLWPNFAAWAGGTGLAFALSAGFARRLIRFAPLFGIVAVGGVVALAFAVRNFLTNLTVGRWRKRAVPLIPDQAADAGTLVVARGQIAPDATIDTLFRARPAVLWRSSVGAADETRGIDFDLVLADGTRLSVDVRGALLLDQPTRVNEPPACGPVSTLTPKDKPVRIVSNLVTRPSFFSRWQRLYETSVGPGDTVEIIGWFERLPPGNARQLVLYGNEIVPLQIRRC
jgi:hypothetical protein